MGIHEKYFILVVVKVKEGVWYERVFILNAIWLVCYNKLVNVKVNEILDNSGNEDYGNESVCNY